MSKALHAPRLCPTAATALALTLAGCAVTPDFQPPSAPQVAADAHPYTANALPAHSASAPIAGGAAQSLALGQDVPAQWWELFHSAPLDELVRSAIAHSPSLAAAQAALRQARELYAADAGGKRRPSVTGQLGATRQRASQTASGVPGGRIYSLYNASVNVSYSVDAFGATGRELEGLAAQIDAQRYQLEAAYLTLTANVVTSAIQEAALRSQLDATRDVIGLEQQALALVEKQARYGAVPEQAVLAQRTQLAQTRATVPALEKALAQTRQQLAVYAGRLPDAATLPEFRLANLHLPRQLPLSVPSALVRQRPDIQASEALLHAASAQVGVATANLYPQLTLSADVGAQSTAISRLFSTSSGAWSMGAGLLAPLFNGGALHAKKRAAEAAYEQALAQYRQTVLGAFLNVANTLRALDDDARTLQAQAAAAALAQRSLDLVETQYRAGAVSALALLDAQRSVQATRIALAQAQAARFADTAALFQSLGGGWWNRGELARVAVPPAFAPASAAPGPAH